MCMHMQNGMCLTEMGEGALQCYLWGRVLNLPSDSMNYQPVIMLCISGSGQRGGAEPGGGAGGAECPVHPGGAQRGAHLHFCGQAAGSGLSSRWSPPSPPGKGN